MKKRRKEKHKYVLKIMYLWVFVLLFALKFSMNGYATEAQSELEIADVRTWAVASYSEEKISDYHEQFYLTPSNVTANKSYWGSSSLDKAYDLDWNSHWEANADSNSCNGTWVQFDYEELVEVGQIIYSVRQDSGAGGKGFPLKFKIQISTESSGENFVDVVEGSSYATTDIISIKFEAQKCLRLRFVWVETYNAYPSASVLYCYKPDPSADVISKTNVGSWAVGSYTAEEREVYNESYFVKPVSVKSNKGYYGSSSLDKAYDDDWTSHWEANASYGRGTYIEFDFGKVEEIGHIVYRARQDAGGKGFPLKYKIQVSDTESGNYFRDVAEGSASLTTEIIKISFDAVECRRLRFVWEEAYNEYPSASVLYCYKEDLLGDKLQGLFIDGAATALAEGVTQNTINAMRKEVNSYPVPGGVEKYLELAELLLSGKNYTDEIHKPMSLSQMGERWDEYNRTGIVFTLSGWDLTGYYVRPGDVLDIFVDADPNGPMPRLVLAAIGRNYSWQYGYDGMVLGNGYNRVTVPEDMKGCQAIYFYNPSLPDGQEYAPVIRLCGGEKYPVYFYDSQDSLEVAEAKEEAFIQEVQEYCTRVVNNLDKAALGEGEPNICEYVSDKVLISTTAKGVLKSFDSEFVWKEGQYLEWLAQNTVKHAVVEKDDNGQVTGIRYAGPAAVMEAWEMKFDDMQLYCGFNIKDPTHEDYRNHGRFVYRAYTDGAGAGWGQQCYSGYNAGSVDMESPMDTGWFYSLVTSDAPLQGSWTEYHELGHLFDSRIIGVSESTNNLFGLSAQRKYKDSTRMENDNRWYNHFTNYINTGVLPSNDLLFYPGAVIIQLDGVDFSGKSIYTENNISNYGRACRYARLHREEIENLSQNDKLVVSFSIACGVDLSSHFEYYGREVSAEAKVLLNGLPKEERPTWLVNNRTFKGDAFSQEDKEKAPVITSVVSNEKTGAVTIKVDDSTFTEKNIQCFSIYRQKKSGDKLVGELEWIGVTGDNFDTKNVNELYEFTDVNVVPGYTYEYSVGVYDCKLAENKNRAKVEVSVGEGVEVPLSRLLINDGNENVSVNVGSTLKVQAVYSPINTTIDLNSIEWWIDGYGRDYEFTGGGEDCILLMEDPDYPGDPTRKLIKGIQSGQTTIYVKLGGFTESYRIVVNGSLAVNDTDDMKYTFAFNDSRNTFNVGETYSLNLYRTTCEADGTPTAEVVRVATTPNGTSWVSDKPDVISVDNRGNITANKAGTATISFKRGEVDVAQCSLEVIEETIELKQISFEKDKEIMNVGDNLKLVYSLVPENTTQATTPVITSNNTCVRVEKDGTITAMSGGEAVVTVTVGEISSSLNITVNEYIPLKNIALNKESVILTGKGSTETLSVIKTPTNASVSDEELIWKSGNESVFTVQNGVITAVGTGTAELSVSLGGKTTSIPVTVEGVDILLTGIGFRGFNVSEDINLTLMEGKSHQLVLNVEPIDATGLETIEWSSADSEVATVSYGYITAISEGTTVITASLTQKVGDGTERTYQVNCNLTVNSADITLEGIGISHKFVRLGGNETIQLSTKYMPTNANVDAKGNKLTDMVWTSADDSIASVDSATGVVTGKKTGTTTITATGNGFSVTCQVVVNDSDLVDGISLNQENLSLDLNGEWKSQLICTIQPETITASPLWKSSNPSIAEVDQNGNVTAYRVGNTVITVTLGDKSASCEVTVTGDTYTVTFDSAGGKEIPAQVVTKGTNADNPGKTIKENYTFVGWYLPNADEAYDFTEEVVVKDITLTAKWQVNPPTASIAAGSIVAKNTEVELSSVNGEEIYYTLDGTIPTKESTKYETPIVLTNDTVIKAFVVEDGCVDSEVVTYTYEIERLSVSFNLAGGTGAIETQGVIEGYTATKPTTNPNREGYVFRDWYLEGEDVPYNFDTEITNDIVLYAKWQVGTPNASVASGSEVAENTEVSLSSAAGADIYYTLNGETPTKESTLYTAPIVITKETTIKAIAIKEGYKDSEEITFTYEISKLLDSSMFSAEGNYQYPDRDVNLILDGRTDTKAWESPWSSGASGFGMPQDVIITLNGSYTLTKIEIIKGDATNSLLTGYQIEVSTDGGENYTVVRGAVKGTDSVTETEDSYVVNTPSSVRTTSVFDMKDLDVKNVTHVKVRCVESCEGSSNFVQMAEVRLHGWEEKTIDEDRVELEFYAASLKLQDDISVNYKIDAAKFIEAGYENFEVKFQLNGKETIVKKYTVQEDGKYVFEFADVAPQWMNDTIYATLYAELNNERIESAVQEYSVVTYCYNILKRYANNEKVRTLIVDLLNYGSEAQIYVDYKTDTLANKELTAEQKEWATKQLPELKSVMNKEHVMIEEPSVEWIGGTLLLDNSVRVGYLIQADSIENLSMKVTVANKTWSVGKEYFVPADGTDNQYYVFVDGLNAGQMCEPIYTTMYNGGTPVSSTMCYSVESYVYEKLVNEQDSIPVNLKNIVTSMIKYGCSAYNYVHN